MCIDQIVYGKTRCYVHNPTPAMWDRRAAPHAFEDGCCGLPEDHTLHRDANVTPGVRTIN